MKKRLLLLTVILVLGLTVLTACSNDEQNGNTNDQNPTTQNSTDMNGTNGMTDNQTTTNSTNDTQMGQNIADTTTTGDETYNESRSQAINDAIKSEVSQAKDVWVMVMGNNAYIALDIDAQDDSVDAMNIKNQVAEIVMNTDSEIRDIYLAEDADSFTRIKDAFTDLTNGKPVSGMTDEIVNLFTRITPDKISK